MAHIASKIIGSLTAGVLTLGSVPLAGAALYGSNGLGLGVKVNSASARTSVSVSSSVQANIEKRCAHLDEEEDRERCKRVALRHFETRGNVAARAEVRASHGKFMKELRHDMKEMRKDMSEEARMRWANLRKNLRMLLSQIQIAFAATVNSSVEVCLQKSGDEQKQCFANIETTMKARTDAAIKILKGI